MDRVNFATMEKGLGGATVLTLVEPGYPNTTEAMRNSRSLPPGEYYPVIFVSPEPVVVTAPPTPTRNEVKVGKPFIERTRKAAPKLETMGKGKGKK